MRQTYTQSECPVESPRTVTCQQQPHHYSSTVSQTFVKLYISHLYLPRNTNQDLVLDLPKGMHYREVDWGVWWLQNIIVIPLRIYLSSRQPALVCCCGRKRVSFLDRWIYIVLSFLMIELFWEVWNFVWGKKEIVRLATALRKLLFKYIKNFTTKNEKFQIKK